MPDVHGTSREARGDNRGNECVQLLTTLSPQNKEARKGKEGGDERDEGRSVGREGGMDAAHRSNGRIYTKHAS